MAHDELVILSKFGDAAHADHLKMVLENNGVRAVVDGGDLKTALSYIGTAIGDVKLLVNAQDEARAREILASVEAEQSSGDRTPWHCGECEETIEGTFDLCWSCGKLRSDVEVEAPGLATLAPEPVNTDLRDPANQSLALAENTDNPYSPPMVSDLSEEEDESELLSDKSNENLVRVGFNFAIFGGILPIVGTTISVLMLMIAAQYLDTFPPKIRRWYFQTLWINAAVIFCWVVIFVVAF